MTDHNPPDTTPWLRRRDPSPTPSRSPPATPTPTPMPPPAEAIHPPNPPAPPQGTPHRFPPRAPVPPRQRPPLPEYTLSPHTSITAWLLGSPGTDAPWYLVQASRYTPKVRWNDGDVPTQVPIMLERITFVTANVVELFARLHGLRPAQSVVTLPPYLYRSRQPCAACHITRRICYVRYAAGRFSCVWCEADGVACDPVLLYGFGHWVPVIWT